MKGAKTNMKEKNKIERTVRYIDNYTAIVIKTVMYIPEQTNGTMEHGRGFRKKFSCAH